MKVKIIDGGVNGHFSWYRNMIGEVFTVLDRVDNWDGFPCYIVIKNENTDPIYNKYIGHSISLSDCVDVKKLRQDKLNRILYG